MSKYQYTEERKRMNKTGGLCARQEPEEFVRELRLIRTGSFAFLATQSGRERKREKTKRAMLPSVPFVDDEVTSQQVLVLEVLYERALHRTSVSAASHLRQIYFRKDCM